MRVCVGHGGVYKLDRDMAGSGKCVSPILAIVEEMNVVKAKILLLCEKQQNYRDGINERNLVNNFLSMSNLQIRYQVSDKMLLEPSLLTQINMKVVAAQRRKEFFRTVVPPFQKEVKHALFS